MTTEQELMLLGQAGVLIHYWKDYLVAQKAGKVYSLKMALPFMGFSSLLTVLLVYTRESYKDLYVVTEFGAIILGYSCNSIFFSMVDTKKPKTTTNEPPEPNP